MGLSHVFPRGVQLCYFGIVKSISKPATQSVII